MEAEHPAVLSTSELRHRLAAETERAVRHDRPLCVLAVRLGEPDASDSDAAGALAAGALRCYDHIGWGQQGELVVVLPESGIEPPAPARRVLEALRPRFPGTRIGVAACPRDGTTADVLLAAARASVAAHREPGVGAPRARPVVTVAGHEIVVADPAMVALLKLARDLAKSRVPVLLSGPSGSGKEVLARALHDWSPRREAPFVAINCAAVTDSLLESELFGHERGAFSGAVATRRGLFEAAEGGVLFLDEVADLSLRAQASLLRALETSRIRRVGGNVELPIDVRLVAATNRSLRDRVDAGHFRGDLYFRLAAAAIEIPPLAARRVEIPPLAEVFLERACTSLGRPTIAIAADAMHCLLQHDWPGNVRELRHVLDVAAATLHEPVLRAIHLPPSLALPGQRAREADPQGAVPGATRVRSDATPMFRRLDDEVRELERARFEQALVAAAGVRTHAAALIGVPLRTFLTKMKLHGLEGVARGRPSEEPGQPR